MSAPLTNAEKQRRFRARAKNLTGRFCACGNAASVFRDRDFVCARCAAWEQANYGNGQKRSGFAQVIEPFRLHNAGVMA